MTSLAVRCKYCGCITAFFASKGARKINSMTEHEMKLEVQRTGWDWEGGDVATCAECNEFIRELESVL